MPDRPAPLSHREPDEIIRVVRAFKEMGARSVRIGDVAVRFDVFEPATEDERLLTDEQAAEQASKRANEELYWST